MVNRYVLSLCFLLCAATALSVHFLTSTTGAKKTAADPAELTRRELRDAQRAEAAAEVARIVAAEHPEAAATGADDRDLLRARHQRLEEMAEAVRHAVATPTPGTKSTTFENPPTP